MKRQKYIYLIAFLTMILVVLVAAAVLTESKEQPGDTLQNTSSSPTEDSTPADGTVAPPQSDPPATDPVPQPSETTPVVTSPAVTEPPLSGEEEMIGMLYTRSELEALENEFHGYGPGTTSNGIRPTYPVSASKEFAQYDAYFIGPDDNRVYLTFNCGYEQFTADGRSITGIVLDTLREKNVKGIFFLALHYCQANPELVRRMIDEGHIVANHGAQHKCMPKQSIDGMVTEIMSLHEYVQENFGYTMKYYRPASGEFSTRVFAVAQSLGYTTLQYSFAYYDYDTQNPPTDEKALETMKNRVHNGAIYQIHTVVESNANALGPFVDWLRTQGYEPSAFPQ